MAVQKIEGHHTKVRRVRREFNLSPPVRRRYLSVLMAARSRDSFYTMLARVFPRYSVEYERLIQVDRLVEEEFARIHRDSGEKYIEHLRSTVLILVFFGHVRDPDEIVAGFLHDTLEDIEEWDAQRLERRFGKTVAQYVGYVTRREAGKGESKIEVEAESLAMIQRAPAAAKRIKLSDQLHNLITLWVQPREKIQKRWAKAMYFYLPLAKEENFLYDLLLDAVKTVKKRHKL